MWFLSFSRCPAAPHLSLLTGHYAVEILQTDVVVNLSQFKWRLASRTLCSSPTPSHQKYDFAKLIRFLFTFRWWVGSLQFRTTLFIHTVSSIPRDSSVLLSSFFTRSMAFTHMHKVQLPFALFSETFLTIRQNSLYVTVCIIARPSYRGYFIHSLSTLHYCNAPSLATRLTGDYRDRTYTG